MTIKENVVEVAVKIEKIGRKIEREVGHVTVTGVEIGRVRKGKEVGARRGKEAEVGIERGNKEVEAEIEEVEADTEAEKDIPG